MRGEPHRRAVLGMLAGLAAAPKTALAQRETSEGIALKEASAFFDIEPGIISRLYDVSAPHVGAENTDPPIFLIGQKHTNSFGEQFTNTSRDEIVKSQEAIVQLLQAQKFRDTKACVFSEGETEETIAQYPRANELDKSLRRAVTSLEKDINEIDNVSLDLAESLAKMVGALKPFSAYHRSGGTVRNILQVAIEKAKPEAQQMLEHAMVAFEGIKALRGEPSPLILGALKHLHATDKLGAICPAEIKELNLEANKFLDEYLAETLRFTPEELQLFAAIKKQGELWDEYDKAEGEERKKDNL